MPFGFTASEEESWDSGHGFSLQELGLFTPCTVSFLSVVLTLKQSFINLHMVRYLKIKSTFFLPLNPPQCPASFQKFAVYVQLLYE